MVPTSTRNFSLAVDATQPIHRACAEINNLPHGHLQIPQCGKPAETCKLLGTCTVHTSTMSLTTGTHRAMVYMSSALLSRRFKVGPDFRFCSRRIVTPRCCMFRRACLQVVCVCVLCVCVCVCVCIMSGSSSNWSWK